MTDQPMIQLEGRQPFASGGNRLCFRHPLHEGRCLKVIREDRTPEVRRAQKSFPANLRPLASYDENRVEAAVLQYLHKHFPAQVRQHLPRTHGLVVTDLGMAHDTELFRDADGLISQTLEQYLWDHGMDEVVAAAIREFKEDWGTCPPRTRDLIPHNFVVQRGGEQARLMVIDGFGKKPLIRHPLERWFSKGRLERRMRDFDRRVQLVLERKRDDNGPMHRIHNLQRGG